MTTPDAQVNLTPRAYLHEPCGILATAQWWREHRGVCDGCETVEGWSPLFSDTDLADPDALDSLPIAALLHKRLAECCESHDCPGSGCEHLWLDRPESDTRECRICGVEVFG